MTDSKTAGIVIIGNEILSGKVKDSNSFFLARELRELGVNVMKISVIPDDIDTIGWEVAGYASKFDYVFTSGGVGPTHDDVTMAGIARGFNVKLVQHEGITQILNSRYKDVVNSAVLKMAEVPEGSEIEFHEKMRFPVVSFRNVFIFPGIPEYMQNKFIMIREKFRSSVFYLKRLYLNCHESSIAALLSDVVEKYKDVTIGSYPIIGETDFRVIITAETKSRSTLDMALGELIHNLPENVLVKIE